MLSREQQVSSLQRTVPSAVKRAPDGSIFDIGLRLSDGMILTLRVELGVNFPEAPPVIRIINPGVTHESLDSSGRVTGLSMLYLWNARTSNLGQVVQTALTHFCTKPPYVNPNTPYSPPIPLSAAPPPPPPPSQPVPTETPSREVERIPIPDSFPELDGLSPVELEELMTNEAAFTVFFNKLPTISTLTAVKESIAEDNVSVAMKTVSHAQRLQESLARVRNLESEVEVARQTLETLLNEEKNAQKDVTWIIQELEHLARQTDDESEQWLSANATASDANVQEYRQLRVLYHQRKAKAERCRAQFKTQG